MVQRDRQRVRAGGSGARLRRLVLRAGCNDEAAWRELVTRYTGLVWSVARAHRLGDADAADVVQATWTKLVEHVDEIRDPAAIGGWLATTARRESIRVLRGSERAVCSAERPEAVDDEPQPDAQILRSERDAEFWRAFGRLGTRDQALLRLLAAEPAPSYAEIGAALGMPIGSIGPTRARALGRLRLELERCGDEAVSAATARAPDARRNPSRSGTRVRAAG
jgi:RNA polymerase sigma factor (sigma-70 family)